LSFSLALNSYLAKARVGFRNSADLDFNYKFAFFDIFNGVFIKGLSITQDAQPILDIGSIRLRFDQKNTIAKKQLFCEEVIINNVKINEVDNFDKSYVSFLLSAIKNNSAALKSTKIKLDNLNIMGLVDIDLGGYIALAQGKILLSKGKIAINNSKFLSKSAIDRSNSLLDAQLDYSLEVTYTNTDFVINKIDLISSTTKLISSGRIKDYNESVNLDFKIEIDNLLLEDLTKLNNEYVYTRGILTAIFNIVGPLDKSYFKGNVKISSANLKIMDAFKINKISAALSLDNNSIASQEISGLIDSSPVSLNLNINKENGENRINLKFSAKKLDLLDDMIISLKGTFSDKAIEGDAEILLERSYNNKFLTRYVVINGLKINFGDSLLKTDSLGVFLTESETKDAKEPFRKLALTNIGGNFYFTGNNIEIKNLKAEAYKGRLTASGTLGIKDSALLYNSKIHLENLETENLINEFISKEFKLSGLLSGNVSVSSDMRESISGDVQIVNGKVENNAVLVSISDFFGLPSLKAIDFSNLKIIFQQVWNQYSSKISLFSNDVGIFFDNKALSDGTVDGHLLAKLTTKLMDESPRFRKLFKYIDYKEPTVYFPFQVKGYSGKPRIEWLKSEFKEKIQDFLSESNKKRLQTELNKKVEELAR
jgi:hypothetical protein